MPSYPKSPGTVLDTSLLVDGANADAGDVTLPIGQAQTGINAAREQVTISATDTHTKDLDTALIVSSNLVKTIITPTGNAQMQLATTLTPSFTRVVVTGTPASGQAGLEMGSGLVLTNSGGAVFNFTVDSNVSGLSLITAQATLRPTAALAQIYGMLFIPTIGGTSANAVTSVDGVVVRVDTAAAYTGNITNAIGFHVLGPNKAGSGTITSVYGLKVEDLTVGTNNYAVYTGAGIVRVGGTFQHDGTTLGLFGATAVTRPTYGAPTGTATRTAFDTTTVTLAQLAERVKAMIDDHRTRGDFA